MQSDCIIIGGGISGLMNAYYLNKQGISTIVIDKDSDCIENKTSFGNAGLLSAFSKTPLSHPRILQDTIELLFRKKSPLYLSSFPDIRTIKWMLKFFLSSNKSNTKHRMELFEKYGEESFLCYEYMQKSLEIDFEYKQEGFVSVFSDKKKYLYHKKIFEKTPHKVSHINIEQIKQDYPLIDSSNIQGAFLLHKNSHINPSKLIINLKKYLLSKGVVFVDNEEIIDIHIDSSKVQSIISKSNKQYSAKNYILASGVDTKIAQKLNTNLIQIPTKGYSLTLSMDEDIKPKIPIMLADKFTIFTPRKEDVRITSLLEIGSRNKNIEQNKINFMLSNIKEITKDFDISDMKSWCGFRPLTPDDKPLIGRDKKYNNFIYSMGLGWLGMTFGPSIGRIVSDLVIKDIGNNDSEDISLFSGLK